MLVPAISIKDNFPASRRLQINFPQIVLQIKSSSRYRTTGIGMRSTGCHEVNFLTKITLYNKNNSGFITWRKKNSPSKCIWQSPDKPIRQIIKTSKIMASPVWYRMSGNAFFCQKSRMPVKSNKKPMPKLARKVNSIISCGVGIYSIKTLVKKMEDRRRLLHALILFCIMSLLHLVTGQYAPNLANVDRCIS